MCLFRGTLQLSTYSVKPVAEESTLDATFSPEGMFVVSGKLEFYLYNTLPPCKNNPFSIFYWLVGSGDGSTHAWGVRSGKQVGLAM